MNVWCTSVPRPMHSMPRYLSDSRHQFRHQSESGEIFRFPAVNFWRYRYCDTHVAFGESSVVNIDCYSNTPVSSPGPQIETV